MNDDKNLRQVNQPLVVVMLLNFGSQIAGAHTAQSYGKSEIPLCEN